MTARAMKRMRVLLLTTAMGLFGANQSNAQRQVGRLTGRVVDGAGSELAGVLVGCTNFLSRRTVVVHTSFDGRFEAVLDPGTYNLTFDAAGFLSRRLPHIVIHAGETLAVDAVMTSSASQLPHLRDWTRFALAAPGLNYGELEGGWQANGASGAENAFLMDGVVTNSLINGSQRVTPSMAFLAATNINTGHAAAISNGAVGAAIEVITKSGGSVLAGEALYSLESSALAASPGRRLVLGPSDGSFAYIQDSKNSAATRELAATFGGPLKRTGLRFIAGISRTGARARGRYAFGDGNEPGEMEQRSGLTQLLGKVSLANSDVRADASIFVFQQRSRGVLPAYDGSAANTVLSSAMTHAPDRTRGFSLHQGISRASLSLVLSARSVMSVLVSHAADDYHDVGVPSGSFQTVFDSTSRVAGSADYSHAFAALFPQTVRAGVQYQRAMNRVNRSSPHGYVSVFPGYYQVDDLGLKGSAGSNSYGLYIQHHMRPSERFSLETGIRLQPEQIPSFRRDLKAVALSFGFLETASPRIALAYRLSDRGAARLTASWGRFFDWTKYALARELFGAQTWRTYYRALDDPGSIAAVSLAHMPGTDLWLGSGAFRDNHPPVFDAIDPAVRPTYQNRLNVAYDVALPHRHYMVLRFAHTTLRHAMEDVTALVNGQPAYIFGNPGEGRASVQVPTGATPSGQAIPRPVRQYDALQVSLDRRFAGSWYAGANYTLSRLYGNYSGLSSSDEILTPTLGVGSATTQQQASSVFREAGNVNRAYDIDEVLWDSHGNLDPQGRLATDRPHVFKLFGSYTAPFGTTFGVFQYSGSGTPISTYLQTANGAQVFVNGRGDMGRTPWLNQTDILLQHDLKVMNGKTFRVEMNVLNVFNQQTARHIFNSYNRGAGVARASSAVSLASVNLQNGYDYRALVAATLDAALPLGAVDPRYSMQDLFNPPLQACLTAKFLF
jgi:Carboxypeptidase regulatory-like domain